MFLPRVHHALPPSRSCREARPPRGVALEAGLPGPSGVRAKTSLEDHVVDLESTVIHESSLLRALDDAVIARKLRVKLAGNSCFDGALEMLAFYEDVQNDP